MERNNKKKRSFKQKMILYHKYYLRTDFYKFLGKNILKLILILGGFVALVLILNEIFDFKELETLFQEKINNSKPIYVYLLFLVSESILGIIPPDLFIVWAKYFESPYLIVFILATISYIGGIIAYYLGILILRFPRISRFVKKKYEKNIELIAKWGGVVIIMAALFPLPFATISTIAGMVKYRFKLYLLYGITRYLRFYLYAIPIYRAIDSL